MSTSTRAPGDRTLPEALAHWAEHRPDDPAFSVGPVTLTWFELDVLAHRVAAGLQAEGIGGGDRVAVVGDIEVWPEVVVGAMRAGAVPVLIDADMPDLPLQAALADARPKLIVVERAGADHIAALQDDHDGAPRVLRVGDEYAEWLDEFNPADPGHHLGADTALQIPTSGTKGRPKQVVFTHRALAAHGEVGRVCAMTEGSVVLSAAPFGQIYGAAWALQSLLSGAHLVAVPAGATVRGTVYHHRVSHLLLGPAALRAITPTKPKQDQADEEPGHKPEVVAWVGPPPALKVLKAVERRYGPGLYRFYAMTEAGGPVSVVKPDDQPGDEMGKSLGVGRTLPGVQIRIVDELWETDVPDGVIGEIWVRSPRLMKGYWRRPEDTSAAVSSEGWLRTGDAGLIRAGRLYMIDRVDEAIPLDQMDRVWPSRVESTLRSHPGVVDAAAIGVPSQRWNEEVKVLVVRAGGRGVQPSDLATWCQARLPGNSVPQSFEAIGGLTRNASGSLDRASLRNQYWAGRERPEQDEAWF